MAEPVNGTPTDRLSRFDRADFGVRQSRASSPAVDAAKPSAPDRTDARTVSDTQLTADHLQSLGWSQEDVAGILGGPAPEDSLPQVEAHLRSLGWTQSEIARLLAGPEKSHLTAEALFQQHAANPAPAQQALVKAMAQAGAGKVSLDPSLLAGLDPTHLVPDKPSDVQQIVAQFAALPDVQKQRFLLLMRQSQDGKQPDSALPQKTGSGDLSNKGKTPSSSDGGVLPVVKSGLDVLGSALKGLLGGSSSGDTKKSGGKTSATSSKSPAGKTAKDKSDEPDESDEQESTDSSDEKAKAKKDEPDSKTKAQKDEPDSSDDSDEEEDEDESTDTDDSSNDTIGDPESSSSGEAESSATPVGSMDPDLEIQPD